jgi:hypothetical protein
MKVCPEIKLLLLLYRWESAMLQNANTRCNGLLPLWGPQVAEANFASCLAKHNTYLLEATRHRDIGYQSTIHDLKLLLLRFAQVCEKVFFVFSTLRIFFHNLTKSMKTIISKSSSYILFTYLNLRLQS